MIPRVQASAFLKELGINDLRGIPLEGLVSYKGIYYEESSLSGSQGRIIFSERSAKITISNNLNQRSKRFVIAHELGHFFLHRGKKTFYNCDEKAFLEYHSKGGQELEANEFASELLIPTKMFREKNLNKDFSISYLEELSEYFDTSVTSMSIKFADYSSKPLAVVFSQNSQINWARINEKFPLKFINTKVNVPSTSIAALYFKNQSIPDSPSIVNAFDWFYGDYNSDKFFKTKIYEQCRPIKSINGVLSYLWIK